jgi:hypothetical protein
MGTPGSSCEHRADWIVDSYPGFASVAGINLKSLARHATMQTSAQRNTSNLMRRSEMQASGPISLTNLQMKFGVRGSAFDADRSTFV